MVERNPFTHTWSLGVEEQFYFMFPLIIFLAYGKRVSRTGPDVPGCVKPAAVLTVGILLSAVLSGHRAYH